MKFKAFCCLNRSLSVWPHYSLPGFFTCQAAHLHLSYLSVLPIAWNLLSLRDTSFFLYLLKKELWSVADSQCCVNHFCKAKWLSYIPPYTYILLHVGECANLLSSWLTLCGPMDSSPWGSSVHGILQSRTLEWVAILFSRGSSRPRDRTHISWVSCLGRRRDNYSLLFFILLFHYGLSQNTD